MWTKTVENSNSLQCLQNSNSNTAVYITSLQCKLLQQQWKHHYATYFYHISNEVVPETKAKLKFILYTVQSMEVACAY